MRSSAIAVVIASLGLAATACDTVGQVTHTFYGYPDNDPPGADIAYDCGRGFKAGGTGTFNDPLTFASAEGEFSRCEVIYDPYLKKYLRYEDFCAQCTTDWKKNVHHIDVWTGSPKTNGGNEQIQCENSLTPDKQTIVRKPASNLPVDGKCSFPFTISAMANARSATELYVKGASNPCRTDHTYKNYNIKDYCKK